MSYDDEWLADYEQRSQSAEFVRQYAPSPLLELPADAGSAYLTWVVSVCMAWYDRGGEWREAVSQLFFYLMAHHPATRATLEAYSGAVIPQAAAFGREHLEVAMRGFDPDATG